MRSEAPRTDLPDERSRGVHARETPNTARCCRQPDFHNLADYAGDASDRHPHGGSDGRVVVGRNDGAAARPDRADETLSRLVSGHEKTQGHSEDTSSVSRAVTSVTNGQMDSRSETVSGTFHLTRHIEWSWRESNPPVLFNLNRKNPGHSVVGRRRTRARTQRGHKKHGPRHALRRESVLSCAITRPRRRTAACVKQARVIGAVSPIRRLR